MQGRHPPIAWTARIVVSRRDSMVFQGGFEMRVSYFRHSAAGRKKRWWWWWGGGFRFHIKSLKTSAKNNCVSSFSGRSLLKACRRAEEQKRSYLHAFVKVTLFFSSRGRGALMTNGDFQSGQETAKSFSPLSPLLWERGEADKTIPLPVCPAWNIHEGYTSETVLEVKICMNISGTIDISNSIVFRININSMFHSQKKKKKEGGGLGLRLVPGQQTSRQWWQVKGRGKCRCIRCPRWPHAVWKVWKCLVLTTIFVLGKKCYVSRCYYKIKQLSFSKIDQFPVFIIIKDWTYWYYICILCILHSLLHVLTW